MADPPVSSGKQPLIKVVVCTNVTCYKWWVVLAVCPSRRGHKQVRLSALCLDTAQDRTASRVPQLSTVFASPNCLRSWWSCLTGIHRSPTTPAGSQLYNAMTSLDSHLLHMNEQVRWTSLQSGPKFTWSECMSYAADNEHRLPLHGFAAAGTGKSTDGLDTVPL